MMALTYQMRTMYYLLTVEATSQDSIRSQRGIIWQQSFDGMLQLYISIVQATPIGRYGEKNPFSVARPRLVFQCAKKNS